MTIPTKVWLKYVREMSAVSTKATQVMLKYVQKYGFANTTELLNLAYSLATTYGEAAAACATELYNAIGIAEKAFVPSALPAQTATYNEVAKAVQGTLKTSPIQVPQTVGRLVKQAGADTMLQNAQRDGAQFAWIPHGDTCAFCVMLASNGWQYMSQDALKNGHAEHIHANCDCEYCVRFDGKSTVKGYDPAKYKKMYDDADGWSYKQKLNSMRREFYAENKNSVDKNSSAADEVNVGN